MINISYQQEKHDLGNLLETTMLQLMFSVRLNNFYQFYFLKHYSCFQKSKRRIFQSPKFTFSQSQGPCLLHLPVHRFTLTVKILSIYFKQESKQIIEAVFITQNSNFLAEIIFPLVKSCCSLKGSKHYVRSTECLRKKNREGSPLFHGDKTKVE